MRDPSAVRTGPGHARSRLIILLPVVALVLAALLMALRPSGRRLPSEGERHVGVMAVPQTVTCGLSGRTLSVHRVSTEHAQWYSQGFGAQLADGVAYQGDLTIVDLVDDSGETVRSLDRASFESSGTIVEMYPFPPTCE